MKLTFGTEAWADYLSLQLENPQQWAKVNTLIAESMRDPFRGIGKPEPLRGAFAVWWSRRITQEHRLIYRVSGKGVDQTLEILQCREHY